VPPTARRGAPTPATIPRPQPRRALHHPRAPKIAGGYNNNFQILQTPGNVVITQEMIHEARIIPLDRKAHLDPRLTSGWAMHRHWEGKTLIVETRISTTASPQFLHLLRPRRRKPEDHRTFYPRQPGSDRLPIHCRRSRDLHPSLDRLPSAHQIDGPIYEYACHEGKIALRGILAGARAQEKLRLLKPAVTSSIFDHYSPEATSKWTSPTSLSSCPRRIRKFPQHAVLVRRRF